MLALQLLVVIAIPGLKSESCDLGLRDHRITFLGLQIGRYFSISNRLMSCIGCSWPLWKVFESDWQNTNHTAQQRV